MAKTNLSVSKYPEIPVPTAAFNFTIREIAFVKKTYNVDEKEATLILKDKFYGAPKPHGYDNWKAYWNAMFLGEIK